MMTQHADAAQQMHTCATAKKQQESCNAQCEVLACSCSCVGIAILQWIRGYHIKGETNAWVTGITFNACALSGICCTLPPAHEQWMMEIWINPTIVWGQGPRQ